MPRSRSGSAPLTAGEWQALTKRRSARPRFMIDGAREPFVTVGAPNAHWVAVRRHHDVTVTIEAREIDPASLIIEPIAEPAALLLGPEPDEP